MCFYCLFPPPPISSWLLVMSFDWCVNTQRVVNNVGASEPERQRGASGSGSKGKIVRAFTQTLEMYKWVCKPVLYLHKRIAWMRIEARLHYGVYRFAICSTDNGLIWGVRRGALVKEVDGMGCVEVFLFLLNILSLIWRTMVRTTHNHSCRLSFFFYLHCIVHARKRVYAQCHATRATHE